jgi:methanol--5-hydroxybenzimidazolylcobamide Co-methyltransferase
MLIYDCRLMNTAHNLHESKVLRKLFVESDRYRDPQALFLDPEVCFSLAKVIVSESDDYRRTLRTAVFACNTMREAIRKNLLQIRNIEREWLDRLEKELASIPENPEEVEPRIKKNWESTFLPDEYGLDAR